MGSCYSGDHNAEDHKHTDTIRCNIEEPQQKYCLGTVSNRLLHPLLPQCLYPNPKQLQLIRFGSQFSEEARNSKKVQGSSGLSFIKWRSLLDNNAGEIDESDVLVKCRNHFCWKIWIL